MLIYLQIIESEADKSKFEQLYIKYRGLLYHVAYQMLHNKQDAEDATHLAFEAIAKNIFKISEIDCPKTRAYIVTITERKSIDILRGGQYLSDVELDEETIGIDIPLPGDSGLADAMARLPARYREILLLRYSCGYSVKEISKVLVMSQGTVDKVIWRAKEALKKSLGSSGVV